MSVVELLSELPVFASPLPSFDVESVPALPNALFVAWLREAATAGVVEPHAMTLSTVDEDGLPDARVVILRDVDDRGWLFATSSESAKGRQLERGGVALSFYWREQGRQVRVRGRSRALDPDTCARDFLVRPEMSREASLVGRQSTVLADRAELDGALVAAHRALIENPGAVAADHTLYVVEPARVEFWQGDAERRHVRLRYRRGASGWIRELLWP
ncbi:pyridoxal 5'-phosphate synthase [Rugosimonospora acidiphila]|uniref:Pyridoxal 5'-phosphate synthase n=1 Tax=Rugosimonospora acidiphila TaxID=556531 RepID=A0ABP9SK66_9ACTN